jgi:hypothetical protein
VKKVAKLLNHAGGVPAGAWLGAAGFGTSLIDFFCVGSLNSAAGYLINLRSTPSWDSRPGSGLMRVIGLQAILPQSPS